MRIAKKEDIDKITKIRIKQQKDDWDDEYYDKYNLMETTKIYLEKHLNKDFYAFIEEKNDDIIALCCLKIIEYLPQCNDNGLEGYICSVYTKDEFRNRGFQTNLLKEVIKFATKNNLCELTLLSDNEKAISIYKKLGFEFNNLAMKKVLISK